LINAYEQQGTIKELAQRFGIHRLTVAAMLKRNGVEQRQVGLTDEQVAEACHLYPTGWSVPRLAARFAVDATTVWRALRAADVAMRSPSQSRGR
jgi:hypothetical protein